MSGSYHEKKVEPMIAGSAVSTDSVGLVSHQSAEDTSPDDEKALAQLQLEVSQEYNYFSLWNQSWNSI